MISSTSERGVEGRERIDLLCVVYNEERLLTMCLFTSSTLFPQPSMANSSAALSTLPEEHQRVVSLLHMYSVEFPPQSVSGS